MTAYSAPGMMDIDDIVAREFIIDKADLYKKSRHREIVEARQLAIYIRIELQLMTTTQSAKLYNRDHCTALWALKQVNALYKTDKVFRGKTDRVMKQVNAIIKEREFNDVRYELMSRHIKKVIN